jgi:hypothetical protein
LLWDATLFADATVIALAVGVLVVAGVVAAVLLKGRGGASKPTAEASPPSSPEPQSFTSDPYETAMQRAAQKSASPTGHLETVRKTPVADPPPPEPAPPAPSPTPTPDPPQVDVLATSRRPPTSVPAGGPDPYDTGAQRASTPVSSGPGQAPPAGEIGPDPFDTGRSEGAPPVGDPFETQARPRPADSRPPTADPYTTQSRKPPAPDTLATLAQPLSIPEPPSEPTPQPGARPEARLVLLGEQHAGDSNFTLRERTVIGRDSGTDLPLSRDTAVSRQHAEIWWDGTNYRIKDLGSSNGTVVGGDRTMETVLRSGDVIKLGRSFLRFEL